MDGHSKNDEILSLLKSKNRCLERLMEATREFLRQPLDVLIARGDESEIPTTPLSVYEDERAAIIRTLEMHDRKINELISALDPAQKTEAFIADVKAELLGNERLILGVFNADEIVFQRIREAQSQITKLMVENGKSRAILSKFKSAGQPTGEEMDRTL
jgi:hypothetical protein